MHHRPPDTDQQKDTAGRWLSCENAAAKKIVKVEDGHSLSDGMVSELPQSQCVEHQKPSSQTQFMMVQNCDKPNGKIEPGWLPQ